MAETVTNVEDIRASLLQAGEYHLDCNGSDEALPAYDVSLKRASFLNLVNKVVSTNQNKSSEAAAVRRVLDHIELIASKRVNEGFNEFNFSVGVLNCFFICYMFGAHPEHIWLVYLVQGLYMIPRKFLNMWRARPLNQALYYLDFCWFLNFTALLFIVGLLLSGGEHAISTAARETFFNAALGVSCGTLVGANILLPFVACLFHDVNTMTGLFIHLLPPMVMYTFMWHPEEIKEAWPDIFNLDYLEHVHFFPEKGPFFMPGTGLDSVAGNSVALYLLWWIPYVCFMLVVGIDLPRKYNQDGTSANPKYDTVFHSTMRGGVCIVMGRVLWGRSKAESLRQMEENDFILADFFVYMVIHMSGSFFALYIIGYPCFRVQSLHLSMLSILVILAVTRGSKRYTYYCTRMYGRYLRKEFSHVYREEKES